MSDRSCASWCVSISEVIRDEIDRLNMTALTDHRS